MNYYSVNLPDNLVQMLCAAGPRLIQTLGQVIDTNATPVRGCCVVLYCNVCVSHTNQPNPSPPSAHSRSPNKTEHLSDASLLI